MALQYGVFNSRFDVEATCVFIVCLRVQPPLVDLIVLELVRNAGGIVEHLLMGDLDTI